MAKVPENKEPEKEVKKERNISKLGENPRHDIPPNECVTINPAK